MDDPQPRPASPWSRRRLLMLLLLLALVPAAASPLHEPDEARYAEMGREMLLTGDWLVPRFHGKPRLSKPPFTYWMAALGERLVGHGALGARILAALAFLATALLVMRLGDLLWGGEAGNLTALIYVTSLLPFASGHFLSTDVFLVFWQTTGLSAALLAWRAGPKRGRLLALFFWFSFGMAFFTKGPPGLLGLIPVASLAWRRRKRGDPAVLFSLFGLALFLGAAFWWYGLLIWRDSAHLHGFLVDEVWNRIFTARHHRNASPLIYLFAFVVGALPWISGYGALFLRIKRWWRAGRPRLDDRAFLLLLWILPALLIFTLARSRMVLYVAPLCVPLALAMASAYLASNGRRWPLLALRPLLILLWCLLLVAGGLTVRRVQTGMDFKRAGEAVRSDTAGRPVQILNGTGKAYGSLGFYAGTQDPVANYDRHAVGTPSMIPLVQSLCQQHGWSLRQTYLALRPRQLPLPPSLAGRFLRIVSTRRVVLLRLKP